MLPAQSGPEEKKQYQWRILVLSGFGDFLRPLKELLREQRDSFFDSFIFTFIFFQLRHGQVGKTRCRRRKLAFAKKANRRWRILAFGFLFFGLRGGIVCV